MKPFLWLVMQYRVSAAPAYELQGIFSTKDLAVAACYSDQFLVVRMELDVEIPIETSPDVCISWFPLSEPEPAGV